MIRAFSALLFAALAAPALAHESLPASLLLTEQAPDTFDVRWRLPAAQSSDRAPEIEPRLPADCRALTGSSATAIPAAIALHWRIECANGLRSGNIAFDGVETTLVEVVVRVKYADGHVVSGIASPRAPYVTLGDAAPAIPSGEYFALGVEHILTGVDHLLFVLCLVWLVPRLRRLLVTVTAFTLAHSVTLALATLGVIHVPGPPVEASIALSIVLLARELTRAERALSLAARAPWLIAFAFGLLHGLGFAGALAQIGLPQHDIPLALLCFNLGVEAGQVLFVATVLALIAVVKHTRAPWPRWAAAVPVYAVGSVSVFWLLQRIQGILQ